MTRVDEAEHNFELWCKLVLGGQIYHEYAAWELGLLARGAVAPDFVDRLLHESWRQWRWWRRVERDPFGAFAARNEWHTAIEYERMQATTERWAMERLIIFADSPLWFTSLNPLPVGRDAFLADWAENEPNASEVPAAVIGQLPFEGDERAALILVAEVSGTRVEMFGLADSIKDASGWFELGAVNFRISSDGSIKGDVSKLTRNMTTWWKAIQTGSRGRGRPAGSTRYKMSDYREAFRQFERKYKNAPQNRYELAGEIGVSPDTVRNYLRDNGITMTEFRREMETQ